MNDQDMILCEYTHPNRGKHPVVGGRTKRQYGYRARGEQFLVHKDDIAAQPHYFNKLEGKRPDEPKGVALPTPPPPPPVQAPVESAELPTSPTVEQQERVIKVNLQLIPGVTPAVEKALIENRLDTRAAIAKAGIEGLIKIKGIGGVRATAIYEYVTGKLNNDAD